MSIQMLSDKQLTSSAEILETFADQDRPYQAKMESNISAGENVLPLFRKTATA